jgi:aminopeptidase N
MSVKQWRVVLGAVVAGVVGAITLTPPLLAQAQTEQAGATPAAGWVAERFDEGTGRIVERRERGAGFEHRRMRLEMEIADLNAKRFTAVQRLEVVPLGEAREELVLDAKATIRVEGVKVDGQEAEWSHDGERLRVKLQPAREPGGVVVVETRYAAEYPGGEGIGLVMLAGTGEAGSMREWPQVYSQGQTEWNSMWFPCHDYPNVRVRTELIVTVPAGFEVVSNGRLVSREAVEGGKGERVRWHWVQEEPHPYYLVSLVVGKFEVVDVGGAESKRPGLAMPVYGPPGSGEALKERFGFTAEAMAWLEGLLDEPYPWAQYAQVVVRDFPWGGMENTGASTLTNRTMGSDRRRHEALVIHELAHQWLGNLVTCRTWADLWLNEGWATFLEAVWVERNAGREAYLEEINDSALKLLAARRREPGAPPMVSHPKSDPDDVFERVADPYGKGKLVLHMLRETIGDGAFWKGTRAYIDRHRQGTVETADFRRAMEDASGEALAEFFAQWCERTDLPEVAVDLAWRSRGIGQGGTLVIGVEQVQAMDAARPAFAVRLPVAIRLADGTERVEVIESDRRLTVREVELAGFPAGVELNRGWGVLGEVRVRTDLPAAEPGPAVRFGPEQMERERRLEQERARP